MDKRVFKRLPVELPLKYCVFNSGRERPAQTTDLSANGIGFSTGIDLYKNTPLEMWLSMPNDSQPLYMRGKVIWSYAEGLQKYRVGVKLDKIDLMGISRALRRRPIS